MDRERAPRGRKKPWFSLRGVSAEAELENGPELLIRILLFVWVLLLLPWVVFTFLSPMAFDGGKAWAAWLFLFFTWSYAPAVYGAFNLLTYSRIVAVPLVVACMYWQAILQGGIWLRWAALTIFIAG